MNVGIHVGHLMGIHTINTWGTGARGWGGGNSALYGLNGSHNQPLPLDFGTYFSFFLKNLPSFYEDHQFCLWDLAPFNGSEQAIEGQFCPFSSYTEGLPAHMHRKTSTRWQKGPLTDGLHLGRSVGRLAYPLCSPSPLRQEQIYW
jgi:hypothetical protein